MAFVIKYPFSKASVRPQFVAMGTKDPGDPMPGALFMSTADGKNPDGVTVVGGMPLPFRTSGDPTKVWACQFHVRHATKAQKFLLWVFDPRPLLTTLIAPVTSTNLTVAKKLLHSAALGKNHPRTVNPGSSASAFTAWGDLPTGDYDIDNMAIYPNGSQTPASSNFCWSSDGSSSWSAFCLDTLPGGTYNLDVVYTPDEDEESAPTTLS